MYDRFGINLNAVQPLRRGRVTWSENAPGLATSGDRTAPKST